ncbi:MAG: HIT family protein [Thermogemmatispora sp.]|uniref:HIT family protein n=1 Tax=Thermogemmatispora sp. TaxID=1968838 RepID=UPI001D441088|nr:HIT family protein [Thermogemmatispora sp.]MBX5451771.1 HIT family protein [Thermogemmatispora sp.]
MSFPDADQQCRDVLQRGTGVSLPSSGPSWEQGQARPDPPCVFCERSALTTILQETPAFLLVADHAPLVEGHLLIIPKHHYACYGAVPAALDRDLLALRRLVSRFAARWYAPLLFWEHGVFGQTVFHAHLHCIPFGVTSYWPRLERMAPLAILVQEQEEIRRWYRERGHYFYVEDSQRALLFPPDPDCYRQVIYEVLWKSLSPEQQRRGWQRKEVRQREGASWLAATARKWQEFCREEGIHVSPGRTCAG